MFFNLSIVDAIDTSIKARKRNVFEGSFFCFFFADGVAISGGEDEDEDEDDTTFE